MYRYTKRTALWELDLVELDHACATGGRKTTALAHQKATSVNAGISGHKSLLNAGNAFSGEPNDWAKRMVEDIEMEDHAATFTVSKILTKYERFIHADDVKFDDVRYECHTGI